jgi:hypothetical protein
MPAVLNVPSASVLARADCKRQGRIRSDENACLFGMEQIVRSTVLSVSSDFVGNQASGGRERRLLPPKGVARAPACQKREDAMDHVQHLREQAERCFRLARDVTNRESRTQLEVFGREFAERADNMEGGRPRQTMRSVLPSTRRRRNRARVARSIP